MFFFYSTILIVVSLMNTQCSGSNACKLGNTKPLIDLDKLDFLTTSDFNNTITYAGYARWKPTANSKEWVYAPIGVGKTTVNYTDGKFIHLNTECTNVTLHKLRLAIIYMKFEFKLDEMGTIMTCNIEEETLDRVPKYIFDRAHYGCRKFRHYPCELDDDSVSRRIFGDYKPEITIVFNTFIYEFDGNPELHKQGKYSRIEFFCH